VIAPSLVTEAILFWVDSPNHMLSSGPMTELHNPDGSRAAGNSVTQPVGGDTTALALVAGIAIGAATPTMASVSRIRAARRRGRDAPGVVGRLERGAGNRVVLPWAATRSSYSVTQSDYPFRGPLDSNPTRKRDGPGHSACQDGARISVDPRDGTQPNSTSLAFFAPVASPAHGDLRVG
jgi:hypothetical protein